jgi:hypothetical protein
MLNIDTLGTYCKKNSLISPTVTEKPTIEDLTGNNRNSGLKIEERYARHQTIDSHLFLEFSKSVHPSSRKLVQLIIPLKKNRQCDKIQVNFICYIKISK